jgi:pimeloyl-ACP methyl ester carboxylesterase
MSTTDLLSSRVAGEGYPVVFLHGFLESNTMWDDLSDDLAKDYMCIFIELPGHGESPHFTEDHPSIDTMMQKVKRTLLTITKNEFSVVGHSLGGYVALNLVASYSNFKGKLILLNSHPWEDSKIKKEERNRVIKVVQKNKAFFIRTAIPNLYRNPGKQNSNIEKLVFEALKMDQFSIENSLEAMRDRKNNESVMKGLRDKCLVIQGEHDHLIDSNRMQETCKDLKNSFTLVKGAGHMAHHEDGEKVLETIKKFI